MAKSKSKKGLSDRVRNKQKLKSEKPTNPFEVKVNKIKHSVVNRKVQKWEKGVPGVSRSKAVKKRKDTLLMELHHLKKANSLLDKRFGENDSSLTADEKMVQRFAVEKKQQLKKRDFSLNEEEEVLTHYGQSLAENLQDVAGTDSEDEGNDERMRTGNLQFGGFSKEGDEVSWKDKMREVIADSKKQKYERQAEKEKTLEATKELDNTWKSLASTFKPLRDKQTSNKVSGYMQLFHNLVLEQKSAGATDKLKTEEENAKEEAERLKQLETERLARMKGISKVPTNTHKSADDLNDGFALDQDKHKKVTFAEPTDLGERTVDEEENHQDKDEENEGDKDDDNKSDSSDNDDEGSEDDSDDYSDLVSENGSESDEESSVLIEKKIAELRNEAAKPKKVTKTSPLNSTEVNENKKCPNVSLPFTFTAPGSYEELRSLLHGHSAEEQNTILSRLRKCHHPSLAEGNKEKLEKIQLYLLHYFGEIVKQQPVDKTLVDHVTSHLWEMTQMFKLSTATAVQNILLKHQKAYADIARRKGGRGEYPDIATLMYLWLVDLLFPTSDFQHSVTTPALHFITQMLSECTLRNNKDVVAGLFLCSLALKFVGLSKRFIPEAVTFLHCILFLGAEKASRSDIKVYPPLRDGGKAADLIVKEKCSGILEEWSVSEMLHQEEVLLSPDQFRCGAIDRCLALLLDCMKLWEDLPCLMYIMEPLSNILSLLPKQLYPLDIQAKLQALSQKFQETRSKKLKVMQQQSKKPVPLKLFEPEILEFWSGKRKKGGPNKEVNERQRLNHKYKREMKAAIREIKRDNEVLAQHQLDIVLQKDTERKRKTKELMHSLANQEGDYKAIKKMKK